MSYGQGKLLRRQTSHFLRKSGDKGAILSLLKRHQSGLKSIDAKLRQTKSSKQVYNYIWKSLCICSCLYHVYILGSFYLAYRVRAEYRHYPDGPLKPPAITFCMFMPFRSNCDPSCLRTSRTFFDNAYNYTELFTAIQVRDNNAVTFSFDASNLTQFMNRTSLRVRYDEVMCYTISFTRYFDSNYTQKFLRLSNPIPIALSIIISPKFERYVANMSTYMGDQGVRSSGVSGMFQGIEPRVAKLHSYGRQKIELLPPPYVTKCYDHSQNGHSSRDLCYKRCKLQFYLKRYNQIPCKVPYDLVDDIAYYDINGSRDDQPIGECLDKCSQIHCNLINYEHTLMFKKNIGGRTSVDLALNGDAEILVIYKPYVTFMEFFAMVGSVLGVWLGLSSLSFVHIGHLFGRKSPKSLPAAGHYVKMAARSKQPSSKLFTRQAMS